MDQALFVLAGQRSCIDYCAEGGTSLGTRLYSTYVRTCGSRNYNTVRESDDPGTKVIVEPLSQQFGLGVHVCSFTL